MSRTTLVVRLNDVLLSAEMLSEGTTSGRFDKDRIHGGGGGYREPPTTDATYDFLAKQADRFLDQAERKVATARKTPGKGMTPEQYRFWLIEEGEGIHDTELATRENISRSYVRKLRQEAGRDPLKGTPSKQAA